MILWLWRLIWGVSKPACEHKWETDDVIPVYDVELSASIPTRHIYVLRCERCGDLKSFNTRW